MGSKKYAAVIEASDGTLRTERIGKSGARPSGLRDGEHVAFKCAERDLELNMRLYILWVRNGRHGTFKRRLMPSASVEALDRAGVSLTQEQMGRWHPKEAARRSLAGESGQIKAGNKDRRKTGNRRRRIKREERVNSLLAERSVRQKRESGERSERAEAECMAAVRDAGSKTVLRHRRARGASEDLR